MNDQMQQFQDIAASGRGDARALAAAAHAGDANAPYALAALWIHAAAAAPERLAAIYDASAEGWTGRAPVAAAIPAADLPPAPIPDGFWADFWGIVLDPATGQGAGVITTRTAALAARLDPAFTPRCALSAAAWPTVMQAAAGGLPERFTLQALALAPEGSLGAEFHALIVDNGFDLEVLDRDALGLAQLPPPLGYLNTRILQCHDLWHILGGYRTTALHEVAISGFQAGQFGHHYSSMFLGAVLTKIVLGNSVGLPLLLDTILSAWIHGRESPPLLPLDWPTLWSLPTDEIRARIGLTPYASPYPADLFEQLRAAA